MWEPLPEPTPCEHKAVVLGTLLAVSCLDLLARLGGRRYWCMLEHPADPGRHPYPSVFATDLIREVVSFIKGGAGGYASPMPFRCSLCQTDHVLVQRP